MCGIAGAFGVDNTDVVNAMTRAIAHRGPDDHGLFFDAAAGIALGHRRLSIIDISSCGHQPMAYAGGRYQIVFNGEIYNFAALRQELEALGCAFESRSDTEVILAAYAAWGAQCVERFRGMFAFAIFDRERQLLVLARDRFGIKPLYFAKRNGVFLFASELKGLLASGLVEPRLDHEALWGYLSLGSMPQPRSALAGVTMLEPATSMIVRRDGTFESTRYWDVADASSRLRDDLRGIDAGSAAKRLRELLDEATRLHMIADVPVGAFLSGGIDSTAVVGLMSQASGQRIRTFSVGFDEATGVVDERRFARISAERFNTEHTEVVVNGNEVAEHFDDLVRAIDQPSLDGTNTFLVSRAAGKSLKVALSGLGGDELFAGYAHFRRFHRGAAWDRWLGSNTLRRRALRKVPGRFVHDRELLTATLPERFAMLRVLSSDAEKSQLVSRQFAATSLAARYEPLMRNALDSVAQTSYVELRRYLVDTLLRDADAMAMASALEVRPVLLDHVVAEFAFALPAALKLNDRGNKAVLVDAVRDLLPPELLQREKTGFELPLQSWLIGPLRDRARGAFPSDTARTIFAEPFLRATLDDLAARRKPSLRIWSYMMLIEWMRMYGVTL